MNRRTTKVREEHGALAEGTRGPQGEGSSPPWCVGSSWSLVEMDLLSEKTHTYTRFHIDSQAFTDNKISSLKNFYSPDFLKSPELEG